MASHTQPNADPNLHAQYGYNPTLHHTQSHPVHKHDHPQIQSSYHSQSYHYAQVAQPQSHYSTHHQKLPPKQLNVPSTPELNFAMDSQPVEMDDDLISLNSMDFQNLELAVNDPVDSSKSSITVGLTSPDMVMTPNFAKHDKMDITSDIPNTSKPVKKITTDTNIHPDHHPNPQVKIQVPNAHYVNHVNYSQSPHDVVTSPEDGYEYMIGNDDPDDGMLSGIGIKAPSLKTTSPHTQDKFVVSTEQKNNAYPKGYAPTPRDWQYDWNATPRNVQSMTPANQQPPRIRDPELIQNTLQSIAYYADKLDGLHTEYRRRYAEQQQLGDYMVSLQQQQHTMDPTEYHNQYHYYQSSSASLSQMLQSLIISIYKQFTEMKQRLHTRHDYLLDGAMRSQFDKFQKYHDQFEQSQRHLLTFGQQAAVSAATSRRHHSRSPECNRSPGQSPPTTHSPKFNDQYQYRYQKRVAQTPHKYQNYVSNSFKDHQGGNSGHSGQAAHLHLPHMSGVHSMTPRKPHSNSYYRAQQTKQACHSTSAIDRKFHFSRQAQQQHLHGQSGVSGQSQNHGQSGQMKMSRTPRGYKGNMRSPRTSAHPQNGLQAIPQMGFVYIGSRMSQLISQIAFAEKELMENQSRIEQTISSVLTTNDETSAMFKGFDIVPYGASTHGLFIKDYSDYDYCVRCKDVSHKGAMKQIAEHLSGHKEVKDVRILKSVEESVHGCYLKDVEHIQFVDVVSGRPVDLVLNNLPEIGASRFIAAYESIDPRFALLCRVVKYWARRRGINEPLKGSLSTFSLVLMVINFLQSRRVLPTLSIMIFDRESGLSPWSTQDDYQINVQKYRDFASKNEEPHSRLLVHFFQFYCRKFSVQKDVVSVRTGTLLTKSEKKWDPALHLLAVENPFNSKVNLTERVTAQSVHRICAEFQRAHSILCESYKVYDVCKLAAEH